MSMHHRIVFQVDFSSEILGHTHSHYPLQDMRTGSRPGERSSGPVAKNWSDSVLVVARICQWKIASLPSPELGRLFVSEVWKSGGARNGHDGHVCWFVVVLLQIPRFEVSSTSLKKSRTYLWKKKKSHSLCFTINFERGRSGVLFTKSFWKILIFRLEIHPNHSARAQPRSCPSMCTSEGKSTPRCTCTTQGSSPGRTQTLCWNCILAFCYTYMFFRANHKLKLLQVSQPTWSQSSPRTVHKSSRSGNGQRPKF